MITLDERFALVDSIVGGFGGMFADSVGGRIAWLVDANKRPQAIAALRQTFVRDAQKFDALVVRTGRYGYRQLIAWRDQIGTLGIDPARITMIDIDESLNKLFIGTIDTRAASDVRQALLARGVPQDAFDVEQAPLPIPRSTGPTLSDTVNPIMGGIMAVGCTISFNVEYSYAMYFATNSHCSPNYGVVDSTLAYQPQAGYNPDPFNPLSLSYKYIGYEAVDPTPRTAAVLGPICTYSRCRFSDVALYRYVNSSRSQALGKIAQTTYLNGDPYPGSTTLTGTPFQISGELVNNDLYMYMIVHKMGRRTGWTYGPITRTGQVQNRV